MAYARRRTAGRSRGTYSRGGRSTVRASRGRSSSRRTSARSSGGTTRLVIEVAGLSGVSRPSMIPQVAGALPKKAKF